MPSDPFSDVPKNADGHFRLMVYASIFRIVDYVRRLSKSEGQPIDSRFKPFPFLAGYFEQVRGCLPGDIGWAASLQWWRDQIRAWEQSCPSRLPLRALERHAGITYEDQLVLVTIGIVEEDIRFATLFAALQEPLVARRPCLGLLAALIDDSAGTPGDLRVVVSRLMAAGLITIEDQTAPRAEWILRVPLALWDAIRGGESEYIEGAGAFYSRREFPPLKKLVMDEALRQRVCLLPAALARGGISAVIVRGMAGGGRRTIMGSIARALRRDLVVVHNQQAHGERREQAWPMLGPLCTMRGALPVIEIDPAPGETVELGPLAGYAGPLGVVMRGEGGVTGRAIDRAVTISVPPTNAEQRLTVWQQALNGNSGEDLESIAGRHLLPLGNINRAATIAAGYAALERRAAITEADAQSACRSLNRQELDSLSHRLEVTGDWNDLVTNESTASELLDLQRRCHHRERLLMHLGSAFRGSINSGVRALFTGPTGTGKTLAAKILASVLSLDLYRVDLASIVNKYVGETEKNLSRLLAKAEELDVLLLIDEGDALMTNRTDVKSANDRYANMETNYLLQRLESYNGLVIVTTNAGSRIDQAFQRRFDVVIDFSPPDSYQRLLIWNLHLPASSDISPAYLQEVAQKCALTGGQIRNAALYAALMAIDVLREGRVGDFDLQAAVMREYRKTGASCPLNSSSFSAGHHSISNEFLLEVG